LDLCERENVASEEKEKEKEEGVGLERQLRLRIRGFGLLTPLSFYRDSIICAQEEREEERERRKV
jgi:hypothetical protein